MPIFEILSAEMKRVQSLAPASYAKTVQETGRRLDLLFDELNEGTVEGEVVEKLNGVAAAVRRREHVVAEQGVGRMMGQVSGEWLVSF
jgi:hypothetical protein